MKPLDLAASAAVLLAVFTSTSDVRADPQLLITDMEADVVIDFTAGGDVSGSVYATGLSDPTGLCTGPNNDIYVAEFATGEITIITGGGDFTDAEPFARVAKSTGLNLSPVGLWCNDELVILTDFQGVVLDMTNGGGDVLTWPIHVAWPGLDIFPTGITRSDAGNYFAASGQGVFRADPGVSGEDPAYAFGLPFITVGNLGGSIIASMAGEPRLYDVTDGGDVSKANPWATLPGAGVSAFALLDAGETGVYAAVGTEIFEIGEGGDLTKATPFATGLSESLVYQEMIVSECVEAVDCDDGDACNGEEQCLANTCVAAEEPLECDDRDACTADSCDATEGCTHDAIENCCTSDLDCEIDEICDRAENSCVPAFSPTTGSGDETGGDETGGDETTGSPPEPGTTDGTNPTGGDTTAGAGETGDTDTDGDASASDGGGCRVNASSNGPLSLGLLLLVGFVRRRRPA